MARLFVMTLLLIAGMGEGWAADGQASPHWGYEGEEDTAHWGMLSPAYRACESGSHQSPINIVMPSHAVGQERLAFHYQFAVVHTMDNGHTIQVMIPPGSEFHLNGRAYRLEQFHFHEPSEHHLDGRTYPMEIHLVHRDAKQHIVVVAVLVAAGPTHGSLAKLWDMFPTRTGEQGADHRFNPQDLLPTNLHHFSYHGSLTTPPCTEGVQWIVLRDSIAMSANQIEQFATVIGNNARPAQPLHDRKVLEE